MSSDPVYLGTLAKGDTPGTIIGMIRDAFGWEITIRGVRQPDGTYTLQAWVGDPGFLRLEIDEVKA